MKRTTILISLVILLMIAVGILMSQKPTDNSQVKVGFILPLTGWGSYWGQGSKNGVELARQDIQKEFDESPTFIIEDSKTDAKEAVNAAQKLISINLVDALYSEFSAVSSAVSPIAKNANKVFMFQAFPNSILKENNLSLKTYFDPYAECKKFVQLARSRGYGRNAVLLLQAPFDDDCFRGVDDENKSSQMNTVFKETFSIEITDFRTVLNKIKQSKPDVIFVIAYEDHGINLFKQKIELGITTPLFCGAKEDCLTGRVISSVPKESLRDAATFNLKIREEFVERYKTTHKDAPDTEIQAAAYAYDGVMYLYRAIKKCPSKESNCILNAILADKEYVSQTIGTGFNEDRIFQMQSQQEQFDGEKFVEVE